MDTLFCTLSKKVLKNIVRFYSLVPLAKNWERYIMLENIIPLYRVQHISEFLRNYFKILRVSTRLNFCPTFNSEGKERIEDKMVWTESTEVAIKFVRAGGGSSLEYIIFGRDVDNLFVGEFVSLCPSIASLSVYRSAGSFLPLVCAKLQRLVACTDDVLNISRSWPQLRHLSLYDQNDIMGTEEVWSVIGINLESLWICSDYIRTGGCRNISRWCRNLKSVTFEGNTRHYEEIANVLQSYNNQLIFAKFNSMPQHLLNAIRTSCPEAEFEISITSMRMLSLTLEIFQSKLVGIKMALPVYQSEDIQVGNSWDVCTNIRKLHIVNIDLKLAKNMTQVPKFHLRHLHIDMLSRSSIAESREIMDRFATATRKVETLDFGIKFITDSVLENFIAKNKRTLRVVCIREYLRPKTITQLLQPCQPESRLVRIYIDLENSRRSIEH